MGTHALHQWIFVGALTLPLLASSSAARAEGDFSGSWQTNNGDMRIEQSGDHASGHYDTKDGRVQGHVDGDRFDGIWAQSHADRVCHGEKMGSPFWGRFSFRLNEDGDRFRGRWSYCDDALGSGGEWTGERHRHYRFHGHD